MPGHSDHRDDLEGEELILERDRYGQEHPVLCEQTVQVGTCPAVALMRMEGCCACEEIGGEYCTS